VPYTINDHRGKSKEPQIACRVCGACIRDFPAGTHSSEYNKPKMGCIEFLRARIKELEDGVRRAKTMGGIG
jgi:epoxyqueuosine reductase QueG